MFHAKFTNGTEFSQPITKVVCVGRNYAEHAKELNNPIPDEPILFIKPESSVVDLHELIPIPETDCHYEAELAILIGSDLKGADVETASKAVAGIGLALDLTRRDLQSKLKEKSHPWEVAKSFDGACPLSQFISLDCCRGSNKDDFVNTMAHDDALKSLTFSLAINGSVRQQGDCKDMLNPIAPLISYMSQIFTLRAGDIILTGTPKGVGVLNVGDQLSLTLHILSKGESLMFDTSTKAAT